MIAVNAAERETVVKKSRFIAISHGADSRAEVKSFLSELKSKYFDATHICSAFIVDEAGNDFGFDDDGEPSGTAGKPIYSALEAVNARKSVIAVVRYFGGIKLGAGGLVRAYRQAASELIAQAGLVNISRYAVYNIRCGVDVFKKASAALRDSGCLLEGIVYNDKVSFTAVAPSGTDVRAMLIPLGAEISDGGARYIPQTEEVI